MGFVSEEAVEIFTKDRTDELFVDTLSWMKTIPKHIIQNIGTRGLKMVA